MSETRSFLKKMTHIFRPINKNKKDKSAFIKCPGCGCKMGVDVNPRRVRSTQSLDHYMCECGTVSHWLFTIVMVCVGYGRFRSTNVSNYETVIGGFLPNRILEDDVLWFYPEGYRFYFVKRGMLVPFLPSEFPRSVTGKFTVTPIKPGRRLSIDGDIYILRPLGFVKEKYSPQNTTPVIYDVDIDPAMFLEQHLSLREKGNEK